MGGYEVTDTTSSVKGSISGKSFDMSQDQKPGGLENPAFSRDSSISIENLKNRKQPNKVEPEQDEDAWNAALPDMDTGPPWSELSTGEKAKRITINTTKVLFVLTLLYFFICSLDLLSSAFKLISGKTTSSLLGGSFITNPIVGLMVGILLTVLVQSSSTSTSIIVSMVSAGLLDVKYAVPIIMGSNVGTSVTNTIVSLTQVGDREIFRRAFAGATVHDMFNWLSVGVLLTLEIAFGMLYKLTSAIVHSVATADGAEEIKILKVITEPFTDLIILLDSQVLSCWGIGEWQWKNSMIEEFCEFVDMSNSTDALNVTTEMPFFNTSSSSVFYDCPDNDPSHVGVPNSCQFLFYNTSMSDSQVGIILLVMSLVILCTALIIIVKLLNSMLKGSIALIIKKTLNADIPYVPWLTGYLAILIGAVMTFIVQSSSIFTSTLTPLIGIGIITVERAYPLTLGSNIGTTTTALLASLAGSGEGLIDGVQIALVHLFFNVFGILIFYPIPFMRFPIPMSKFLGNITANYRWFAIFYLVLMFFLMPTCIFLLSLGGTVVLWCVLGPFLCLLVFIGVINVLQNKKPSFLPRVLQTWEFLPLPLRSLQPYDKVMTGLPCCKSCRDAQEYSEENQTHVEVDVPQQEKGVDNPSLSVHI